MEETKKFDKDLESGKLVVVVNTTSNLVLPHNNKQVDIGTFDQVTTQFIDKDKIPVLLNFVRNQKEKGEADLAKLEEQLVKLKAVDENLIPEKILKECEKAIDKGSKAFKKEMRPLQQIANEIRRNQQTMQQIKFLKDQLKVITNDFDEIKKLV